MEKKSRRQELALYVLPRAAESAALIYVSKRWLPHVRLETCVLEYVYVYVYVYRLYVCGCVF